MLGLDTTGELDSIETLLFIKLRLNGALPFSSTNLAGNKTVAVDCSVGISHPY